MLANGTNQMSQDEKEKEIKTMKLQKRIFIMDNMIKTDTGAI